MNKLNITGIKEERVAVEVVDAPSGLGIVFKGDIDMEDPGKVLDPLFEKVHAGMTQHGLKEIHADFTGLNFLNSSGIKAIAKWIMKLGTLSQDKRYRIVIKHNKSITWQITSLPTLSYLIPGAVKIE